MNWKRASFVAALIAGLIAGAVWCAGPCCGSMGASPAPLSIGSVPCCGTETPGRCETSIQRPDDRAAAPAPPSLPPVAALGHAAAAPVASLVSTPISIARPFLPRPDLVRLDVPLLI